MTILKCDKCGAELDRQELISIGRGLKRVDLCSECAEPVIDYLVFNDLFKAPNDRLEPEAKESA